jgi:hypothetical protein
MSPDYLAGFLAISAQHRGTDGCHLEIRQAMGEPWCGSAVGQE